MLDSLLRRMIKTGNLTVHGPGGRTYQAGDGTGPPVTIRLTGRGVRRILASASTGVGEAYMEEDLTIERGSLWDLLEIAGKSGARGPKGRGTLAKRMRKAVMRRLQQINDRAASLRNVAHHYDISNDLYRRFLDADMQYSCAYFPRPGMTLEEAQSAKKAHIAAKLNLSPGMRVLDIGSGWGGMALTLAERARFELKDYRDLTGPFDRVVSVGMLEHVGAPNLRAYFETVKRLLTDDGVALIHTIGRMTPPATTSGFTQKYIFPGGYIPALSEVTAAVQDAGLWITDMEILRLHYAETAMHWRLRFLADPEIPKLYDARFRRMWEFYLAGAELGFRYGTHMVAQLQLTKRVDVLPITRDYIHERELQKDVSAAA
jgi:cyclopropane-fatty-acyl-phospholipid synthase